MTELHKDGYILLPKLISQQDLQLGLSSIKNDQVDYLVMKSFIDTIFMKKISVSTDITSPIYMKFRFSNNNNSTDASTFHGDIYNYTNTELLPIYTCLCYFDEAQLEVIPGSHLYNRNGYSISSYNQRKVIHMKPGDILVFHANLHHRGVNYNKTENRRLLQVFEIFPDQRTFEEESPKLTIVLSSQSSIMKVVNTIMYYIAKTPIIDWLTFFHYILMYNDIQYKVGLLDVEPSKKDGRYISYEPARQKNIEELQNNSQYEDINVNIICNNNIEQVPTGYYYLYFYILYWIVSLIIIYIIAKMWYKSPSIVKRPFRSSKNRR